jgi:hypothetical protein
MSTITVVLEPDADGTLHLPLPAELRRGRVKVVATLEIEPAAVPLQPGTPLDALKELRKLVTFKDIADPVAWQREQRLDRPLPGRRPALNSSDIRAGR